MNVDQGLKVVDVAKESYGASIGIEVGDSILAYNSEPLGSVNQLIDLITQNEGSQVTYQISRNGVEKAIHGESKVLNLTLQPALSGAIAEDVVVSSPLSLLFYTVAFFSLISGIVMGAKLWPENTGYGIDISNESYMYSWFWFTAGVVQFSVFVAVGKVLVYLKQIVENTSAK